MDLKSYQRSHPEKHNREKSIVENNFRKTAESYAQKSDEELLSEIVKTARQGKANGSITNEELHRFASNVSPMLNDEQRARLQIVMDIINQN